MVKIKTTFMAGRKNKKFVEQVAEEMEIGQGYLINMAIAQMRAEQQRQYNNVIGGNKKRKNRW